MRNRHVTKSYGVVEPKSSIRKLPNVSNEDVARGECLHNRNSKDFKDRSQVANRWEKSVRIGREFGGQILKYKNIVRSSSQAFEMRK